jgi:hypothetical protein
MSTVPLDPVFSQQFQMPAPKKKGGMFGNADWKSAIIAAIGGALAARGNPAGQFALQTLYGQKQRKEDMELQEQDYQRRRTDGLADYEAKQRIEQQYASPPQPTEFERIVQAGGFQPGTKEYVELMRRKAEAAANPIVMTPYGPMPYSQVAGPQKSLPQTLSDGDWNDGGPTPQASGGFLGF